MRRLFRMLAFALAAIVVGGLLTASPAQALLPPEPGQPVYGPYPASTAIDGRGSMVSSDRIKTDAYLTGQNIYLVCQDSGGAVGGSSIWDYTREGYWIPDAYVKTGTTGFVAGIPRCLALGIDGHANAGSAHGPYPAKVDIDGRGSADPNDRIRTNAYLAGSAVYIKCQDTGIAVNGSTLWDYTSDGYWVPDTYILTGTSGTLPGVPTCTSLGIPGAITTNQNGGRQFSIRTTLNGYYSKSLSASKVVDKYPEGRYITVMCQAYGAVNYGGSAVWDKTSDGLWVADYYVVTGSNSIIMNRCDNDAASGSGNRYLVETTLNGYYSKSLAASRVTDKYAGGSYITVVCQAYGEWNYGGSAVWDKTSDGLWVADYYVKTGSTDIIMSRCDNDPKPTGGIGNPTTPNTPTPGSFGNWDIRDKIVNAALSQVGVHEWGDNCNPYGASGVRCGDPWCAMFASWTWRMAGIDVFMPYSGTFETWGRNHNTLRSASTVRPGDVVMFGYSASSSNHIGVVSAVDPDGRITTIEGNFGNQVQIVGPYSFAEAASYHPGDGGIYAVVAPVNDSSRLWQSGTPTPNSNCTDGYSSNGLTYQSCLEADGSTTRGVLWVSASATTVARVSLTMSSKNGVGSSVGCQSRLLRAGQSFMCVTDYETQRIGYVRVGAIVTAKGAERPELRNGDTFLHGSQQESSENFCGPATMQAAAWTMGASPVPTQTALADASGTGIFGTLPENMAKTLSVNIPVGMGYDLYKWDSFGDSNLPLEYGLDRVRRGLDQGQPSILLVKPQLLPWGTSGGNGLIRHYVMIHGYGAISTSGDVVPWSAETFRVWDPASDTDHTMTWEELITASDAAELPGDITTIVPNI